MSVGGAPRKMSTCDSAQWTPQQAQVCAGLFLALAQQCLDDCHTKGCELYSKGAYREAEPFWSQARELAASLHGPRSEDYARRCCNLGVVHQHVGRFDWAELLYLEALELQEALFGKRHPDYALSCSNLAGLYKDVGSWEKAEQLYLVALTLRETLFGKRHPDYASSCSNLAALYRAMGSYEMAELLHLEALELREALFGKRHPDYAMSCNNLAGLYQAMGSYDKAEPLFLEALRLLEALLGKRHPNYASSCNNLAGLYQAMGRYEKAEPFYLEALTLREALLGKRHPEYAATCNNLAALYRVLGSYEKAEPLYLEALELHKAFLGKRHPDYASSCNNLAVLYTAMGCYEKAESLSLEALELLEALLGKKHPSYVSSCNNLAGLYEDMGNYEKAEPLYLEALTRREALLGKRHPDYASSCNNLAGLYKAMGSYEKAEPLYLEALTLREALFGNRHPDYALSCNNLAGLYQAMGSYKKAEPLYLEALRLQEALLGKKHPDYATSRANLAGLYQAMGSYEKAERLQLEALELQEALLGKRHPYYAGSCSNLAGLYVEMGTYEKGEALAHWAVSVLGEAGLRFRSDYGIAVGNLALLRRLKGDFASAFELLQDAASAGLRVLDAVLPVLPEERQLPMIRTLERSAMVLLDVALQGRLGQDAILSSFALSASLKQRALCIEDSKANLEAAGNYDLETASVWAELRRKRLQLAHWALQTGDKGGGKGGGGGGAGGRGGGDQALSFADLLNEVELLEGRLKRLFRGTAAPAASTLEMGALGALANLLRGSVVLADYVLYHSDGGHMQATGGAAAAAAAAASAGTAVSTQPGFVQRRYAVFVVWAGSCATPAAGGSEGIPGGRLEVRLFDVGPQEEVDEEVLNFLNLAKRMTPVSRRNDKVTAARILSRRLLAPVLQQASAAFHSQTKHLFISPDGALACVPFVALPQSDALDAPLLLEAPFAVSYLSSVRQLFALHASEAAAKAAAAKAAEAGNSDVLKTRVSAVVCDPDFGSLDPGTSRGPGRQQSSAVAAALREAERAESFKDLPGTAREGLGVQKMLREATGTEPVLLQRQEATAENLLALESPLILHIATHGFVMPETSHAAAPDPADRLMRTLGGLRHPLLRSGLAMAGARRWQDSERDTGGILTAYELRTMNLHGTKLVVLSTCNSGRGDIWEGQGVVGLQRAVEMAGAQAVLATLWPIDDQMTQQVMLAFYRRALEQKQGLAMALQEAQLEVFNRRDRSSQEVFWAPFVLYGRWGPLQ